MEFCTLQDDGQNSISTTWDLLPRMDTYVRSSNHLEIKNCRNGVKEEEEDKFCVDVFKTHPSITLEPLPRVFCLIKDHH